MQESQATSTAKYKEHGRLYSCLCVCAYLQYGHVVGGEAFQGGLGLPGVSLSLSSMVVFHADLVSDTFPPIDGLGLLQDEQVDVHQQEGMT